MTLPEIRVELHELADLHGIPRLAELADEMRRRTSKDKAPATSQKITPELVSAIRQYRSLNPQATQHEICLEFDVNQGRVSEILNGKRT